MKLSQMVEQAKEDSIIENDTTTHVEQDNEATEAARDAAELKAVIDNIKDLAGI